MRSSLSQQYFNAIQDVQFKRRIQKRGGLGTIYGGKGVLDTSLVLSDQLTELAVSIASKRHISETGIGMRWSYIKSERVGAFADKFETFGVTQDFIGVHSANTLCFLSLFAETLSNPEILPWIGVCKNIEYTANRNRLIYYSDLNEPNRNISSDFQNYHLNFSPDPQRHLFTGFCCVLSELYIVFHEISHCRNGHLDLENLDENRKVLEFDADCGAILQLLEFITNIQILELLRCNGEEFKLWSVDHDNRTIQLSAYDVTLFAVVFSSILIVLCNNPGDPEKYPSVRTRVSSITSTLFEVLRSRGIEEITDSICEQIIVHGHLCTVHAYNTLFPNHEIDRIFPFDDVNKGLDELKGLSSDWRKIHSSIVEVRRWGSPAEPSSYSG
jgi:hypothetical protein